MNKHEKTDVRKEPQVRKKLNLRFVICLIVAVVLLGGGVHLVHGFQMKRSAGVLLELADKAAKDKDANKEIAYLERYLGFVPKDTEALIRYAEQLDERAKKSKSPSGQDRQRAFSRLEYIINAGLSDRRDLRRRQVNTAMAIRYFRDARDHLDVLLATAPADAKGERAELENLRGWCFAAERQPPKAVEAFKKAIGYAPDRLESYRDLALLYSERLGQRGEAIATILQMVKANPKNSSAWVQAARLRLRFGINGKEERQQLIHDVEEARRLAPNDVEVILVAADLARLLQNPNEARQLLRGGLEKHPSEVRLYLPLIVLEADANELDKASALARQGLEKRPDNDDLHYALAELHVRKGELKEAEKALSELRSSKTVEPSLVDYVQARIEASQGQWSKARQRLERTLPRLAIRRPELEASARMLLGQCAEALGNPDQALADFQRARQIDSPSVTARYGAGTALLALGRPKEALAEFRAICDSPKAPTGLHTLMARLLINNALATPAKDRGPQQLRDTLKEIRDALARAAKQTPDSAELTVLQAQLLLVENPNDWDGARELIEKGLAKRPDQPELWVVLAQLAGRDGKNAEALKVLDRAEERSKLRGHIELRLARLDYLDVPPVSEKPDEQAKRQKAIEAARQILTKTEKEVPSLPEADQPRLLNGLAAAYGRLGDEKDVERLWKRVAELQPNNLAIRLVLFDLALLEGKQQETEDRLNEIKRIEGEGGTFWHYGEASRRIFRAKPKDNEALSAEARSMLREARRHLVEAAKQRPSWSRIPTLLAEIDELENQPTAAIDKYQEAMKLGESRPAIIRRLVELLFAQRRFTEANQLIDKLRGQEATLLQAGLGKMLTESVLSQTDPGKRDPKHALELALLSVSPKSKAWRDQLWLSKIYTALGKSEEAHQALKRACELAPDQPDPWVALVGFLVEKKQTQQAEQTIEQARRALPKKHQAVTLATSHELLGNLKQAESDWLTALREQPDDSMLRHNLANFYLRHEQSAKAEEQLRQLLKSDKPSPDVPAARRALALILSVKKGYHDFQEAQRLIKANLSEDRNSEVDKHAQALVLATRISEHKQAIELLESLATRGPLIAIERFALVQLYIAEGNWEQAQTNMSKLRDAPGGTKPEYFDYYIRQALQRAASTTAAEKELALRDAEAQLVLLQKSQPQSTGTRDLETMVLQARGKNAQALALARRHVQESTDPDRFLLLATVLSQQYEVVEALDQCEQALRNKVKPEKVVRIMTTVVRRGEAGKMQCDRVEKRLKELLAEHPESVILRTYLADLYDFERNYDKAEEHYLESLKQNPKNPLILNNLAWLLAFKDGRAQAALDAINRAIDEAGPSAELLDTRAVIHLMMKQSLSAIEDLRRATAETRTASRCYHLAQAYLMAGNRREADRAWREAKEREFKPDIMLHRLERQAPLPRPEDVLEMKKK